MFVEQGSNTFVLPYYEDVICQVVYNDLGAFSIKENHSMWTGGVHPYQNVFGLNYDLITGRELTYSDILEGTDEEIDRILRYYFEKSLGTPTDTELEILKEDTEYVLCKEGLCFYYKTGDAPPPTQIIIPYTSEDTYVISVKQLLSELYPLTYDFFFKKRANPVFPFTERIRACRKKGTRDMQVIKKTILSSAARWLIQYIPYLIDFYCL